MGPGRPRSDRRIDPQPLTRAPVPGDARGDRLQCSRDLRRLHADGVRTERIVAVGGGTKGGLWTQIVSDVTGVPQELSEETIGASYGDALFAARAAGLVEAMDTWATYAETVQPRPALRERYDRLYGIYGQLYPGTVAQVHELAEIQRAEGLVPEGEPATEAT